MLWDFADFSLVLFQDSEIIIQYCIKNDSRGNRILATAWRIVDDNLQDSGSAREKPWSMGDVSESGEKFKFHI